eukprot:COSAG01_NODE_13796_length_1534_cov_1.370035_2_plen_75_part_00
MLCFAGLFVGTGHVASGQIAPPPPRAAAAAADMSTTAADMSTSMRTCLSVCAGRPLSPPAVAAHLLGVGGGVLV